MVEQQQSNSAAKQEEQQLTDSLAPPAQQQQVPGSSTLSPMHTVVPGASINSQSPHRRIASQILEIDQTQNITNHTIGTEGTPPQHKNMKRIDHDYVSSNLITPSPGVVSHNAISTIKNNTQNINEARSASGYGGGLVGNFNSTPQDNRSLNQQPSRQAGSNQQDRFTGGEIHIPTHADMVRKQQEQRLMYGTARDESFELLSPGHRSTNSAYHVQLQTSQQKTHSRAASSAHSKQYLMETGAKVTGLSPSITDAHDMIPLSPKSNGIGAGSIAGGNNPQKQHSQRAPNFKTQSSLIRVRNESLSSAGKVIGSSQQTAASNAQRLQQQSLIHGQVNNAPMQHHLQLPQQHLNPHQMQQSANSVSQSQTIGSRNQTNESAQSFKLPQQPDLNNITVGSLSSANHQQHGSYITPPQQQQLVRLKNMDNQQVNRSGQGPRNQTVQSMIAANNSHTNPNMSQAQQMRSSQYNQQTGAQSLSPNKRTPMGTNNQQHPNFINSKGSILSLMSPALKSSGGTLQPNAVNAAAIGNYGISAASNALTTDYQQRQFQIQGNQTQPQAMLSSRQSQQQQHQQSLLSDSKAMNSQRLANSQMMAHDTGSNAAPGQINNFTGYNQDGSAANNGRAASSHQVAANSNHSAKQLIAKSGSGPAGQALGQVGQLQSQMQQQQQNQPGPASASSALTQNQQLKNYQISSSTRHTTHLSNQPLPQQQSQVNQNIATMKPNEPGALGGANKPPQQVISRTNPGQGQNSFRGPVNKPSPLKSQGAGGIMGSRQGVGGLGVTPSSNLHQPNNLGTNSILGSQMSAQQQMNPLFKMGQGMPPGANTTGQLHPHHTGMGMQGQVIGNSSNQTQANITGLSHPSTATHQNATHEHLNSTVGSHNKTNDTSKDSGPSTNPTGGSGGASLGGFGHNEGGFKMFERENFKFKDSIMIHVIDDSKNEKRDFTFSRSLLVKYMKYFDRCLKKISDNDEIDISIHCDAAIFEWLLNYIFAMEEYEKKQSDQEKFQRAVGNSVSPSWQLKVQKCNEDGTEKEKGSAIMQYGGPKLDYKNAVTILIPAEFLKIDRLVRECLDFIGEHIEEISRVQVDMSCINTNIIREMAKKVSLDRLDVLKERKDKIVSRLFMKKLELLLEKDKNHLYKCAYCNKLFTKKQRKVLSCRKGTSFIDSNGQMRAKHVIDRNWDLKKFVTFVRETYRISWKEIYWKVWSYLHLLKCDRCMEYYPIAEMGYCRFHKQAPKIKMSATPFGSQYEYPCCEENVSVYQVLQGNKGDSGCQTQLHETRYIYNVNKAKEKKIIDRIIAHQLIILENPSQCFIDAIRLEEKQKNGNAKEGTGFAHTVRETTQGMTPTIVRPSSLNYKISLIEAVKNFIAKERCGPDQQIEVELEETTSKKMAHFEVLDDALFNLQFVPKYGKDKSQSSIAKNKRDSSHRLENQWEREEEQIRKKLEKNSINLMKSKIAQQARAEQSSNNNQQAEQDQQAQAAGQQQQNQQQNTNQPTTVQLSQNQIEEAKQMTQGKLKMYRRDRLFASDKDRISTLYESLKNVRIVDEAAYFNSQPESTSSPAKNSRARDGAPPTHKGPGKGGDRGGGNSGAGGGASGSGAGGTGYGYGGKGMGGGIQSLGEKGGSAHAKGSHDNYSSHNRPQNRNQAMASAMAAAMGMPEQQTPFRVIKGLSDVIEQNRSNSGKRKNDSPVKKGLASNAGNLDANGNNKNQNSSSHNVRESPVKIGTTIDSQIKVSPKGNNQRAASRDNSHSRMHTQGNAAGMNPILKSPEKRELSKQPMRNGQGSAKQMNGTKFNGIVVNGSASGKQATVLDNQGMMVTPSAFI